MSTLPTRSFNTIVANISAGIQARLPTFVTFAAGSVFLAIAQAFAGTVLWIQGMILSVAMLTRLSTSYGNDVDSFLADYGIIERLGAVAATGYVVFSRYTASGTTPKIPIGTQVKTLDGTQVFQVYADSTNPNYDGALEAYVMPAQIVSLTVPIVSITPSPNSSTGTPGSNGNVAAGSIGLISGATPGVDAVINPAALTNGFDEESDQAVKPRFRAAVAALSRATPISLEYAIGTVQQGMQSNVLDNSDKAGNFVPGMVSVIVDDGSGAMSDALLAQCQAAVASYKAAGVRTAVYKATRALVTVQLTVSIAPGYIRQNVVAILANTISTNINTTGLANGIPYFTVGSWALGVPGVAKIDNLLVNGAIADLPAYPAVTYKCAGVTVN